LGTRARPLTRLRAKPAFPVAGTPLIRRVLESLASGGVRRCVLNLHHLPQTVLAAVGNSADLGLEIRYSWEDPVLGSAGGPRRAMPLLESRRALLVNGDTLTDVDVEALHAEHDRSGALVTMALIPNPAPERYGGVLLGEDEAVSGFVPRRWPEPTWHFIGTQIVEASAFDGVSDERPSESVGSLYPQLMRRHPGSVRGFRCHSAFHDVGTPSDYLESCIVLAGGSRTALLGDRCRVAGTATVARSVLWEDVQVEDGASLQECIVTDKAVVPAGSSFRRCILVPRWHADRIPEEDGPTRCGDLLVFPLHA
jgi:mannose-1-phosphate guanylyltransferase